MSKSPIIDDIYKTYVMLSKNGKFVNYSAEYQKHLLYNKDVDVPSYMDLPTIELPVKSKSTIKNTTKGSKRQKEDPIDVEVPKSSVKRKVDNELDYEIPPEPYIEPKTNLPVRMCYPSTGYCKSGSPTPNTSSRVNIISPKQIITPKINLPQETTIIKKIPSPKVSSPKKSPPLSGEKKDENIIKYIKKIDSDKLIPRKTGGQIGYQSHELKEIAQKLGLKPKNNKQQIIDQIKEIIDKYS